MKTILVVEDSNVMRGLIASILEDIQGCEVVEVSGGFEALKQLPRRRFDLIITDINMADINGLELISFIRGRSAYQKTPIVVVTSEKNEVLRKKTESLGVNAFLVKPLESSELEEVVKELIVDP